MHIFKKQVKIARSINDIANNFQICISFNEKKIKILKIGTGKFDLIDSETFYKACNSQIQVNDAIVELKVSDDGPYIVLNSGYTFDNNSGKYII